MENKAEIEQSGLSEHMVYCNPSNPYLWKQRKQKGVDKVLHVGKYRIYVEDRFSNHSYYYRISWFQKSTMQRFQNYPHTKSDIHVVCTNRPENYSSVQPLAQQFSVLILSTSQLVDYIQSLTT